MARFARALFDLQRDGGVVTRLRDEERDLLETLPDQLAQVLAEAPDDAGLRRLFPPAYIGQLSQLDEEYQRLMADDIAARRRSELTLLAATARKERLTAEEADAWLGALNDLRLYLGTKLDVSEETEAEDFDEDDPGRQFYALYSYLGYLQEHLLDALVGRL